MQRGISGSKNLDTRRYTIDHFNEFTQPVYFGVISMRDLGRLSG